MSECAVLIFSEEQDRVSAWETGRATEDHPHVDCCQEIQTQVSVVVGFSTEQLLPQNDNVGIEYYNI